MKYGLSIGFSKIVFCSVYVFGGVCLFVLVKRQTLNKHTKRNVHGSVRFTYLVGKNIQKMRVRRTEIKMNSNKNSCNKIRKLDSRRYLWRERKIGLVLAYDRVSESYCL